jgi:hypothetical protein
MNIGTFVGTANGSKQLHDLRTSASNQRKENIYSNRQTDWKPRVLKLPKNTNLNICLPIFNTFELNTSKSSHHG